MSSLVARVNIGLRFAAWLVLTFAAVEFCLSKTVRLHGGAEHLLSFLRHFGGPLLIGLLLGWALGLVGRGASWPLRIAVAVISVAMVPLYILFMLFFGCAVWNSMAHGYRCGL